MSKTLTFLLKIFIFCFVFVSQLVFFTNFSRDPFIIQRLISIISIGAALVLILLQFRKQKEICFSLSKADIALLVFVAIALISLTINYFYTQNNIALLNNFLRRDFTLIAGLFGGYFLARLLFNNGDFIKTEDKIENYKYGFLLFLWGFLWIPFSCFKVKVLSDIYALLMWGACFYLLLKILTKITLRNILDVLLLTGVLAAGYGICQYLGYDFLIKGKFSQDLALMLSSTFGNPNFLASFLLLVLPFGIIFYLSSEKDWEKRYYFLVNLACIIFLILSQSRSSWIAAIFVLAALIAARPFRNLIVKNKMRVGALLIVLLGIFLILPSKTESINKVEDMRGAVSKGLFSDFRNLTLAAPPQVLNMSYHQRLMSWTCGINNVKKKPLLGWGWGSWQLNYAPCQGELLSKYPNLMVLKIQSNSAHNIFIETITQSGFLGLAAYLLFLFLVCSVCIRYYQTQKDNDKRILALALGAACLGFLTDNMLNISFQIQVISSVFYFLTGIIISLNPKNKKIKMAKISVNLLLILIGTIFLFLAFVHTKILFASHYSLKGYLAAKANNYKEAQKMFDKSVSLYKESPETHFIYLRVLEKLNDTSKMNSVASETLIYFPEYYEFYNIYAIIQAKLYKPQEAFSNLKKSFILNPYFKDSFNLTLHLFTKFKELRTSQNARFIESLKPALSFKNAFSLLLWQIYFEQEEYDKARAVLLEELARNKFDINVQQKLALTNEKLNIKNDSALQEAKSLTDLREQLINSSDVSPALFKKLKEAASNGNLDAQMLLAQAYFKQKDYQNCRLILETLYQNHADNLPLNFAFASLAQAQGKKEESKKYLQAVLNQDKENALALRRLKAIN